MTDVCCCTCIAVACWGRVWAVAVARGVLVAWGGRGRGAWAWLSRTFSEISAGPSGRVTVASLCVIQR